MAIAQLRHVLTAVLLCTPAHAIGSAIGADIVTCSFLLQRARLLLGGAALVAPFAATTAGGCNMNESTKAQEREGHKQRRFGSLYREHRSKAEVSQEDAEEREMMEKYKPKLTKSMVKKIRFEIDKWKKEQGKGNGK